MSILWLIPIAAAIGGLVWYLSRKKAQDKAKKRPLTFSVDIPAESYDNFALTPGGVTVRSHIPVPPEALQAIDDGISHQIRNSSKLWPGWTAFRNLNEYQVFLIPPHTHNVETDPGSPAIKVRMLDANGVDIRELQSAGTCIGVDGAALYGVKDDRYPSIVLPYEEGELPAHLDYFRESARNESEHIAEWGNNKQMFFSFAIAGDQHPHFPDE